MNSVWWVRVFQNSRFGVVVCRALGFAAESVGGEVLGLFVCFFVDPEASIRSRSRSPRSWQRLVCAPKPQALNHGVQLACGCNPECAGGDPGHTVVLSLQEGNMPFSPQLFGGQLESQSYTGATEFTKWSP